MRRDLLIYLAILALATAIQYALEFLLTGYLRTYGWPMIPWILNAVLYGILGASAWLTLVQRSLVQRIALVGFVAVVPHLTYEITHGSDPAYPYIGLLFIVPDLVAAGIGAGLSAVFRWRLVVKSGH